MRSELADYEANHRQQMAERERVVAYHSRFRQYKPPENQKWSNSPDLTPKERSPLARRRQPSPRPSTSGSRPSRESERFSRSPAKEKPVQKAREDEPTVVGTVRLLSALEIELEHLGREVSIGAFTSVLMSIIFPHLPDLELHV